MYTTITYLVYTALSIGTTIWVAQTLFRNGRIFVIQAFGGDQEMGDAVNKLLAVGFYLVNIGFVAFFLSYGDEPNTLIEAIEYISVKMGVVLFFLGGAHMFNVFNFGRMRRKATMQKPVEKKPNISHQPATAVSKAS